MNSECKKTIQGYLEYDGLIVRVSSIEIEYK